MGQSLLPHTRAICDIQLLIRAYPHMVAVREHVFTIAPDDTRPSTLPSAQSKNALKQSTWHREQLLAGSTNCPEYKPRATF
ncbi:hypothetical protein J4727_16100 [Providencia rettgeri]|uniref:Uncharacterized protein n=1 Tax=Providencia rettgeri TaxID=587 RepID=A0A939NCD6_PRORE|nr:hypothetical protein [Providencia rettgeri]